MRNYLALYAQLLPIPDITANMAILCVVSAGERAEKVAHVRGLLA
jgi:hypothetical protein